jgi:tRNA 2-thiouridine synthesizing protein E
MHSNAVIPQSDTIPVDWFDAAGYFARPELWDRQVAARIALAEGIPLLTAKHWEVINHVRGKYFQLGALPVMRLVCRACGLDRHKAHKLFGSCQSLWRVAGLPNPGEEAHVYMN